MPPLPTPVSSVMRENGERYNVTQSAMVVA